MSSLLSKKISISGAVFTITTILLVSLVIFLLYLTVFGPDAANRRSGVPETGYEGLIGTIIIFPTIVVLAIVDIFAGIAYFSRDKY